MEIDHNKLITVSRNCDATMIPAGEKIVLIEVPKAVYPEIRSTLFYLFEKSGFKNVNLEKEVDFEKLYEGRKI